MRDMSPWRRCTVWPRVGALDLRSSAPMIASSVDDDTVGTFDGPDGIYRRAAFVGARHLWARTAFMGAHGIYKCARHL